jgi:hypothetical protein
VTSSSKRVVFHRMQAQRRDGSLQLTFDLGTPFGKACDHRAVVLHLLCIAVCMTDGHRADARLEAMAQGLAPACRPSTDTGTMSAPCSASRPCTGRTKCTLLQPSASW